MLAGRQPVAFGGRVDLKDMGFGAVDGLLPLKNTQKKEHKTQQISMLETLEFNKLSFHIRLNGLNSNLCTSCCDHHFCNLHVRFDLQINDSQAPFKGCIQLITQ